MASEILGAFHSTKISRNSGPKLNGTVLSIQKIFRKEGPPFEVDCFFQSDHSDWKLLFHSKKFWFAVPLCCKFLEICARKWMERFGLTQPENFPIYCSFAFFFWVEWKAPLINARNCKALKGLPFQIYCHGACWTDFELDFDVAFLKGRTKSKWILDSLQPFSVCIHFVGWNLNLIGHNTIKIPGIFPASHFHKLQLR